MNTYTQPHHIADDVSRWTSLGVELPAELEEAIEVYETLKYTEVGHRPVFELTEVTTANAEKLIRAYADELVLSASNGGLSPLEKAKNAAVDSAARRVNTVAGQAVRSIIDQLTSRFENHVEAYAEAVLALPREITSESLVAAGPDAVALYGTAQQEAAHLNQIRNWVAGLNQLPGGGSRAHENVITILRPADSRELIELDKANVRVDATLAALNPVWVAAVRLGVQFAINTPREAAERRKRLEKDMPDPLRQKHQNVAYLPTA